MKILIFAFAFLSIGFTVACKKTPVCTPAFSEQECKELQDRSYPNVDVSSDPTAWYKATVEGQPTSVGTGIEDQGIYYSNYRKSLFRTTSPTLDPSVGKSFDFYEFGFDLYKPKGFVGQTLGLISIRSSQFDKDTVINYELFMDNMLSVGKKAVDDGTYSGTGWDITLGIHSKIESATQTGFSSVMPLFTSVAKLPISFNSFEITKLDKEDLGGGVIRYTFWCSFQAELYRLWFDKPTGQYFGNIENGEAKFYVDINK
jgi:hypothetical protein